MNNSRPSTTPSNGNLPPSNPKVERWAIFFTGFRQFPGQATGLERLYFVARQYFGTFPNELRVYRWNDCVDHIAEQIATWSAERCQITLIGYSWGAATAVRLANLLLRQERQIDQLFLCDPVARSQRWFRWWRSYFGLGTIAIPPNVRRVIFTKQTATWPRASWLTFDRRKTQVTCVHNSPTIAHQWMDDQRVFHFHVMQYLRGSSCHYANDTT